jgi:hypothetical protein
MFRIALALFLLLAVTGCARPHYGLTTCPETCAPATAGEETVHSLRYRVRTDAGRPAAHEIDRFMERAAVLWTPLLGVPDPLSLPLEVHLHCDPADLVRVLTSQKLTAHATGLYLPSPIPAIHVACSGSEPGHPYRTLLHEGTHQFIHLGAGYREPGRPATTPPRLTLPLWLNEGLASYYEAAFITPDLLQSGRADPARLNELQTALRRNKVPTLATILARRDGEPFTSLDYAIAWGMVYALMQEAPPPWATGGREWLKALVDEARRGWPSFPPPTPSVRDDLLWRSTVTDRTRTAFETFVADRGLSMPAWEMHWREWILAHP